MLIVLIKSQDIKTKEEILKEKKDDLMEKYSNKVETLSTLIKKYRCPKCEKFKKN